MQYTSAKAIDPEQAAFIVKALTVPGFLPEGETYTESAYVSGNNLDFCYACDKRAIGRGKGKTAWVQTVFRKMNPDGSYSAIVRTDPVDADSYCSPEAFFCEEEYDAPDSDDIFKFIFRTEVA